MGGACVSAPIGTCANPFFVPTGGTFVHAFTTVGATLGNTGTCGFNTNNAPDIAYQVAPSSVARTIVANVCGAAFDTVMYARSLTCSTGASVACNDDFCGLASQITFAAAANTTYFIIVDGYNGNSGTYTLTVTGL